MITKTEYVKVELANDKELAKAYSEMDLYVQNPLTENDRLKSFNKIDKLSVACSNLNMLIPIYKKVEVKINLIKEVRETLHKNGMNFNKYDRELINMIRDNDRFIIVLAHTIAELTEDPRSEL